MGTVATNALTANNIRQNETQRKNLDYHQRAGCPRIPEIICLHCSSTDRLCKYKGKSAYKKHCRGKNHKQAVLKHKEALPETELYSMMEEVFANMTEEDSTSKEEVALSESDSSEPSSYLMYNTDPTDVFWPSVISQSFL